MIKNLSHRLALQFTFIVFSLLMLVGVLYLSVDYLHSRALAVARLEQRLQAVDQLPSIDDLQQPGRREQLLMKVLRPDGSAVFTGNLLQGVKLPFKPTDKIVYNEITLQGVSFELATEPVTNNGQTIGYVQLLEPEADTLGGLPLRVLLFLLVSLGISGLTYIIGLRFVELNLRPVRQSFERLEQFTQDASHELRTPLTVLESSLDLALKTKKYRQGLVSAKEDLMSAQVLIDRLLTLAQLDRAVLENDKIKLSELVAETIEDYEPAINQKGLTLIEKIAPNVQVNGDATLIRQLISNLVANGLKFTNSGSITVQLTPKSLSISDTGIGIPPADLDRIFDRFYQVDPSRAGKGYGLGLAFVQKVVELHRWRLQVSSQLAKGSSFTVLFRP